MSRSYNDRKELTFEGYSIPDYHRIQLVFSNGLALNYHNWKSLVNRLYKMLEDDVIDICTFDRCSTLAAKYIGSNF